MSPESFHDKALERDVDRSHFQCDVLELDDYFKGDRLFKEIDSNQTSAYIMLDEASQALVGYYTLSNYAVPRAVVSNTLARRLFYDPSPATLLGRLAIQNSYKGKKIGKLLLARALQRAKVLSMQSASRVVVVDTISDHARAFYMKCGFQKLSNERNQFYYDLRRVE